MVMHSTSAVPLRKSPAGRGVDTYLGNAEQNDSRKIYPAKAQRFKFEFRYSNFEIFLGVFASLRETWFFAIFSSFPNFKDFWLGLTKDFQMGQCSSRP